MSNCYACKFYSADGCGVNLDYWTAFQRLSKFDELTKAIAPFLQDCSKEEASPEISLTLTLTENQWRRILNWCICSDPLKTPEQVIQQVRQGLNIPEPTAQGGFDDIPF